MVALKQLLPPTSRVREYVVMKEAEGAIRSLEDLMKMVQQWAETRTEDLKDKMDIDMAEREKERDSEEDLRPARVGLGWVGKC